MAGPSAEFKMSVSISRGIKPFHRSKHIVRVPLGVTSAMLSTGLGFQLALVGYYALLRLFST